MVSLGGELAELADMASDLTKLKLAELGADRQRHGQSWHQSGGDSEGEDDGLAGK
jgi:hypothetical protein